MVRTRGGAFGVPGVGTLGRVGADASVQAQNLMAG
jgi:hypothetical protein